MLSFADRLIGFIESNTTLPVQPGGEAETLGELLDSGLSAVLATWGDAVSISFSAGVICFEVQAENEVVCVVKVSAKATCVLN